MAKRPRRLRSLKGKKKGLKKKKELKKKIVLGKKSKEDSVENFNFECDECNFSGLIKGSKCPSCYPDSDYLFLYVCNRCSWIGWINKPFCGRCGKKVYRLKRRKV